MSCRHRRWRRRKSAASRVWLALPPPGRRPEVDPDRVAPRSFVELLVEREVQFQHIHARLTKKTELTTLGRLCHEPAHVLDWCVSLACDPRDLVLRGRRRDVRIEPAR